MNNYKQLIKYTCSRYGITAVQSAEYLAVLFGDYPGSKYTTWTIVELERELDCLEQAGKNPDADWTQYEDTYTHKYVTGR